jgi:ribosomal protein S18 acetylase RimI-like enzyme
VTASFRRGNPISHQTNGLENDHVRARIYSSFADIRHASAELFDSAQDTSFDQSFVWFEALAKHVLTATDSLQLVCVHDDGLAAVLPVVVRKDFGGSLVGHTIASLANYYTAHFGPVIRDGDDRTDVVACLADFVTHDLPRWHTLDLNPVDRDEPWVQTLAKSLQSNGYYVRDYFRFGNWYLDVGGRSFDEYYAGLPGKLRNTVKRKGNKLEREACAEVGLITDVGSLDRALRDYWEIYKRSWKQDEPYPEFIEQVCREYAQRGWLRFGRLTVDGSPAAAQVWFVRNGTASIFKLAYDPAYSQYSVGSLLTKYLMQHVIDEDKVNVVDYLCGDDAYKRDWMSHRRERSGLRAYNLRSPTGACCAGYDVLVCAIKGSVSKNRNRG